MFLNSGILAIKLLDSRKISSVRCVCIAEKRLILSFRPPICPLVLIKIPEECFLQGFYFYFNSRSARESGGTEVHAYVKHRPISKCKMTHMCDY
jgi:hypothetical protein